MFIVHDLSALLPHTADTFLAGLSAQAPCFCWETPDLHLIAFDPLELLRVHQGEVLHYQLKTPAGEPLKAPELLQRSHDIFGYLQSQLQAHPLPYREDLPSFYGGYAGFYGYDMVQYDEPVHFASPDTDTPDACFYRFDQVLVFSPQQLRLFVHDVSGSQDNSDPQRLKQLEARAQKLAQSLRLLLEQTAQSIASPETSVVSTATHVNLSTALESSLGKTRFCEEVGILQAAIQCGDIFQAVLSEHFATTTAHPPLALYKRLRQLNPSPYHFYLHTPDIGLMGASPEMLVRRSPQQVTSHPIAGTRPRGQTPEADLRLAQEMRACEKEQAEHLMLVDLARNDLGRVSEAGSVSVSRFQEVAYFSHVMHLVSEVQGRPRPEMSALDTLRACFPAGTLSGAPKVRAMQYLGQQEPRRRKWYGGAIFCLGFDQQLDACIAIRSLRFDPLALSRPGESKPAYRIEWQAGAGIVADSQPDFEYAEVCHKAQIMQAVLA
jgi:anthranilate synthase component I